MSQDGSGTHLDHPWSGRLPLVLGHRGAPRVAPENRREALATAFSRLDGVETDLHRTQDGVLVVNHDPFIGSQLTVESLIALNDLADLRRAEPALLTLADLRGLLEEYPQGLANLELKTGEPFNDSRAADLAKELAGWPPEVVERVWVSSFDPLELLRLAERGVAAPLAFLAYEASALALLPSLPVAAVHPHHSLVTAEGVRQWHAAGLAVFVWTVNEEPLARRLLADGVDGIIGDVPEVLLGGAGRFELGHTVGRHSFMLLRCFRITLTAWLNAKRLMASRSRRSESPPG